MFVLGMAFIDLFIGGFVLPMRFESAYGNPLTLKLCAALSVGESCALASVIYAINFMVYTRLYDLKTKPNYIQRRYLILLLLTSWIIFFFFYGIPFIINYSSYVVKVVSTTTNVTYYCTTYITTVHHPQWMSYIEIGVIYTVPFLSITIGLIFLIHHLCQAKPRNMNKIQRQEYRYQKQVTWHVVILAITFIFLWLPWVIIRILVEFYTTSEIQRVLQITYYILVFKCAIFPILYASTNSSFRGSFAIYRHKRITTNDPVWTINPHFQY